MSTILACNGSNQIDLMSIVNAVNDNIEQGGILWLSATVYEIGDIVIAVDGSLEAFTCSLGHTSAIGDNVNGSPKQPLATNWEYIIPDGGWYI